MATGNVARSFNLCYRYTDDFNNIKFTDYVRDIYPSELNVEKANKLDDQSNYLDSTLIKSNNIRLYTKLYDKHDDFNFHIANLPFLSSNIPSDPSYGVYISQLIRHARCCTYYDDFGYRHKLPVDRLLSRGYKVKTEKFFPNLSRKVSRFNCKVSEVNENHDE